MYQSTHNVFTREEMAKGLGKIALAPGKHGHIFLLVDAVSAVVSYAEVCGDRAAKHESRPEMETLYEEK